MTRIVLVDKANDTILGDDDVQQADESGDGDGGSGNGM